MIQELIVLDNPILHKKANKVVKFDKTLAKVIKDLIDTLIYTGGLGIAAPQIGCPYQMFITNISSRISVYINPEIKKYSSAQIEMEEGCLSLPGYRGLVNRPSQVTLTYQDKKGKHKTLDAAKLPARVVQHETDHLNGVLYVDRLTDETKLMKIIPIRIVFFGTPDIGLPILSNLMSLKHSFDYEVVGVVSGSEFSPVAKLAQDFQIPVVSVNQVATLKDPQFINKLVSLKPDIFVVTSFGRILPLELLSIPRFGSLNVHFSLLPKYKGPSPVQSAILNGDKKTGVTIFLLNEKIDEGEILSQKEILIKPDDTFQSLSQMMSKLASKFFIGVMHSWINGRLKPTPQNNTTASYTKLLTRDGGYIDLSNPPNGEVLERMIRAYYPWPGVWTKLRIKNQESRIKLLPGKLVQIEGKKPVPLEEFKRGCPGFGLEW